MSVRFCRRVCGSASLATLVAACGGSVFAPRDDGGNGASSGGGNSSQGASSATAGKTSAGGSGSSGGSSSVGGTRPTAGTTSTGGSSTGGSMGCQAVDCAYPLCSDGQMPVTKPGQCCPTCPPPLQGCANVKCQPVMACPAGYVIGQPPGACCEGCVPQGGVACVDIACPPSACPLGYVGGDAVGGCCTDCVPDRLFCNDDSECVIADRPRSCCGCPEPVTRREYDADACWSDVDMPRPIPKACYPQVTCDALCGACPPPLNAVCSNHRCQQTALK